MRLVPLGLAVTLALAATATADPPAGPDLEKLDQLRKEFGEKEKREREAFLKQFDTAAKRVGADHSLATEVRVSRVNAIKEQKTAFERYETLPGSDDMLWPLLQHMYRLHLARRGLSAEYTRAMERALKAGDADAAKRISADKAALDKDLPGRDTLTPQSWWKGTRFGPRGGIDFGLWVGKIDDNAVRGTAWQNGTVEMKVQGKIDGSYIEVVTTEVKGAARVLRFSGFILENKIVLAVDGIAAGGGPASGLVVIRKDRK